LSSATRIRVLPTPGHTPESVCLVVTDLRRARQNAAELYDSIHQKLLTLPNELEVFPGNLASA
jgi:glyoxylase-like metal-dependent hydrolase (beta-lactamase superfamily II)